jgi:GST-like protein
MIDLYTWTTPNAQKVSVMLEEIALPYAVHVVNLPKGEQHAPAFLAVNPHGKVPAIVDREGPGGAPLTVVESGAILIYLAEKAGALLAPHGADRAAALEWLMFQTSGIGPTFHDLYYFMALAPERLPHAVEYFMKETTRVLGLLERRLADREYLAGGYSIADVATFPWITAALAGGLPGFDALTNVKRWHAAVAARPAVARGMAVPAV